ncbi:hypothetical protein KVR01_008533 [Diaporthe batatas]|uniref:uncharacterized protein n=1 Tax=Diaporthe batatas TaxID=748121 RepID=UPI001D04F887|nr:uncharacterized protein KVR01_008533 [Diaporthe batatas]KAG8161546.1 hypothetical protein KVR01_008533 [Diaporthe batatas]
MRSNCNQLIKFIGIKYGRPIAAMTLPFPVPPGLLAPEFKMLPITDPNDAEQVAEVYYAAFQTDPGNTYWWSADTSAMMEWMIRRIRRKIADPSVRHFKIVDTQSGGNEMVAFARWDVPKGSVAFGEWAGAAAGGVEVNGMKEVDATEPVGGLEEAVAKQKPVTGATEAPPPPDASPATLDVPRGADLELCRGFFDGLSRMSDKWMADDMLGLSLIATSTKYFKKGAAKALILTMLNMADTQGHRTYLEATPAGKPIYEKYGFREVDRLEFNLDELTKDRHGVYKLCIMIREPVKR